MGEAAGLTRATGGAAGTMTPGVLGGRRGTLAPMMASVTFGEPDPKTVYLGNLMGSRLPSFPSPVAGAPPRPLA